MEAKGSIAMTGLWAEGAA